MLSTEAFFRLGDLTIDIDDNADRTMLTRALPPYSTDETSPPTLTRMHTHTQYILLAREG